MYRKVPSERPPSQSDRKTEIEGGGGGGGRIHGIAQKEYRKTVPPLRMRSMK